MKTQIKKYFLVTALLMGMMPATTQPVPEFMQSLMSPELKSSIIKYFCYTGAFVTILGGLYGIHHPFNAVYKHVYVPTRDRVIKLQNDYPKIANTAKITLPLAALGTGFKLWQYGYNR